MVSYPLINEVALARLCSSLSACREAAVSSLTAPHAELERLHERSNLIKRYILKALFEELWAYIVNIRKYISELRLYQTFDSKCC